jgi:hypothetical protein
MILLLLGQPARSNEQMEIGKIFSIIFFLRDWYISLTFFFARRQGKPRS